MFGFDQSQLLSRVVCLCWLLRLLRLHFNLINALTPPSTEVWGKKQLKTILINAGKKHNFLGGGKCCCFYLTQNSIVVPCQGCGWRYCAAHWQCPGEERRRIRLWSSVLPRRVLTFSRGREREEEHRMATVQCSKCTAERKGFRRELDSWRHKLIHCVGMIHVHFRVLLKHISCRTWYISLQSYRYPALSRISG